jgi:acetyltransferase-like isoleucine patch superfamily enzyme
MGINSLLSRKMYRLVEELWAASFKIMPAWFASCVDKIVFNSGSYLAFAVRAAVARKLFSKCGMELKISSGVVIKDRGNLRVGTNVSINEYSFISAAGGLTIGDEVLIGHGVSILTSNHNFFDPTISICKQGLSYAPVIIENNCWIGARATILSGVTISTGCVIAAGAVVTKDIPAHCVVGGVPGKVIKRIG